MIRHSYLFLATISIVFAADSSRSLSSLAAGCVSNRDYFNDEQFSCSTDDKGAQIQSLEKDDKKFYCISYEKKYGGSTPDSIEFNTKGRFELTYTGANNNSSSITPQFIVYNSRERNHYKAKFAFVGDDANFDIVSMKINGGEQVCKDHSKNNQIWPEVVKTDERKSETQVIRKEHCGKVKIRQTDFPYEKDLADPGKFPWFVAIVRSSAPKNKPVYKCAGTIVNDKYILTLASCLYERNKLLPKNQLAIQVSPFTLSSLRTSEASKYEIEEIKVHPEFNFQLSENNIAIIKIKDEIQFSDFVQPACMPYNMFNIITGSEGKIVGYGNLESDPKGEVPRVIDFSVEVQKNRFQFFATIKGESDYVPDLGSGLFIRDNRYWRIIGMVESKAKPGENTWKADRESFVLMNIELVKEWIDEYMGVAKNSQHEEEDE